MATQASSEFNTHCLKLVDCRGRLAERTLLGDGTCHSGGLSNSAADFNCSAFDYDGTYVCSRTSTRVLL